MSPNVSKEQRSVFLWWSSHNFLSTGQKTNCFFMHFPLHVVTLAPPLHAPRVWHSLNEGPWVRKSVIVLAQILLNQIVLSARPTWASFMCSYYLELCRFLKIRNCKSRFLLPLSKNSNCELKNDSFSTHFTILLANDFGIDSRKNAKNGQGVGIAILLEWELTQP